MRVRTRAPLWKKLLIDLGVCLLLFFILMLSRGGFASSGPAERWQQVSDSLFVPGILMMSVGLLVWGADCGVFDMLTFALQKLFSVMRSEEKRAALPKTFYDYKLLHEGKEKAGVGHMMAMGLVFIAAAGIALAMYAQYGPL